MGRQIRDVIKEIDITPTVSLGAYSAGDQVGGVNTVSGVLLPGATGIVVGARLVDLAISTSNAFSIFFYKSLITGSGDNNAFQPTDADSKECTGRILFSTGTNGVISLSGSRLYTLGPTTASTVWTNNCQICADDLGRIVFVIYAPTGLTFGTTSDLRLKLWVKLD